MYMLLSASTVLHVNNIRKGAAQTDVYCVTYQLFWLACLL